MILPNNPQNINRINSNLGGYYDEEDGDDYKYQSKSINSKKSSPRKKWANPDQEDVNKNGRPLANLVRAGPVHDYEKLQSFPELHAEGIQPKR